MPKLRVLETYVSYQGEGPNTGKPTIFVRFAGCNLKCPGWPCDTQHAIRPELFTKEQRMVEPEDLVSELMEKFPAVENVCVTGGEPFLQHETAMTFFLSELAMCDYNVEVFTNGQIKWPKGIGDFVDNFIMDWKLPGSGEAKADGWEAEAANIQIMSPRDALKFTIKDEVDYRVARARYSKFIAPLRESIRPVVYCGIVWGGELTTEQLCQKMIEDELPWRLNVQVHKFIWDPNKRGV